MTIARKQKKKGFVSRLGDGFEKVGRGAIGLVGATNRYLDKVNFARITPSQMIGGRGRQVKPQRKVQQEMMYCPVCVGWVKRPHHHKVVSEL